MRISIQIGDDHVEIEDSSRDVVEVAAHTMGKAIKEAEGVTNRTQALGSALEALSVRSS